MSSYSSIVLVLFFLCNISFSKALKGFSVEIMHRDSEESPFYRSSETHYQRVAKAIQRSIARVNHFTKPSASLDNAQTTIVDERGEYLMKYSVGTPPFEVLGIVDTGSNVIWMQCQPCQDCYKQNMPIFDPAKSKTYKNLPCSSKQCLSVGRVHSCSEDGRKCEYTIRYGDGSHSSGDVSVETLTLSSTKGSPVQFPNTVIGCGNDNTGTFQSSGSGIVGLSGGSSSLISQLSSTIQGKFSYCLGPLASRSKLSFGDDAVVSGEGTVSTPMTQQQDQIFYYLTLESFSVGAKKIAFGGSSSGSKGNIIIDSGTTLTLLPSDVYTELESAVADAVKLERANDPHGFLSLCFASNSGDEQGLPVITAHFRGADLKLQPSNTFLQVADGIICLAFRASSDVYIYGNVAQTNFLVGYDLHKQTVSFKPTKCSQ